MRNDTDDLGKMLIGTSAYIEEQVGNSEWKWKVSSVDAGLGRQERVKQ